MEFGRLPPWKLDDSKGTNCFEGMRKGWIPDNQSRIHPFIAAIWNLFSDASS